MCEIDGELLGDLTPSQYFVKTMVGFKYRLFYSLLSAVHC